MSNLAGLILVLANQGHWFGGQAQTVSVQWATESPPVEAVVTWDLLMGEVRLGGGRVALDKGGRPATINVTLPEVRVRTDLQLVLRLGQREPANALASLLLSVGLVLLVAAFLYVLWSPMKALLLQFALQLRELISTVQFR